MADYEGSVHSLDEKMNPFRMVARIGSESRICRRTTWTMAACCVLFIIWMSMDWHVVRARATYTGQKVDYYSSQVHGFLCGHLYMDKEADPGLASPDPAVRARAPSLLDASYYKGRYYLYFGVIPAALFLLPYALLTGGDLDPRWLVILCSAAGFLFSVGILRMAGRDHFQRLGAGYYTAAVAILAFASAVPSLLTWAKFYEVAIASGYGFTMAGAFWIYRALSERGRPQLQIALASLCMGLAVGCRPDLVLNIPVVAFAAYLSSARRMDGQPSSGDLLRSLVAAVAPAAFIGALLALYNFERFGSPFEFGVSYSLNSFMQGDKPLFSLAYFWPNAHWYYLTPPALSPYFPYVFPEEAYFGPEKYRGGEAIHGQFVVFVLLSFVAISAVVARKRIRMGRLAAYLGIVSWMFLSVFVAVCAIGFRGDRYAVDFQGMLALGIVLLGGAVASVQGNGFRGTLWRVVLSCVAALSAAFNIFAGLQIFDSFENLRPSEFEALQALGNYPAYWLGKMGLLPVGPFELKVIFPAKVSAIEPLLVAGTPEATDSLYVIEHPSGNEIELLADHSGFGGPRSGSIGITPGKAYTLSIDMGALYPPLSRPFTNDQKGDVGRLQKTRFHVEMDGRSVLDRKMESFDAPPWAIQIGKNDVTMNPFSTRFSGRVISSKRLPPPPISEKRNDGLWRIRCILPLQDANRSFPLLSSGIQGSGTLIYINVLANHHFRFGIDQWGYGGGLSAEVSAAQGKEHVIEILIGPLARDESWPQEWRIPQQGLDSIGNDLIVWLDGEKIWTANLRREIDPLGPMFEVASNRERFSTAESDFPGQIASAPYSRDEENIFLSNNLKNAR
jgi:hypothetical protein